MDSNQDPPRSSLALPPADLARLLTRAGGQPVTLAMIEADRAAGAPVQPDGTIHLVHYAAWLARETARHD